MTTRLKVSSREVRRLQTRERVLGAAIAEFKQAGMAGSDVSAIVDAAGVAHGTFYFHFPTKGHVLLELESREEARVASEFARFLKTPHDLTAALREVVRLVADLEQRLGSALFKEILVLHLSPSRPVSDEWMDHPVIVLLVGEIERARANGEARPETAPFYSAILFLLGLHGVLSTATEVPMRDAMLNQLITSTERSMEVR